MANGEIRPQALIGTWKKIGAAACAAKYPETINFSTGTYRGTRGVGQGLISWDAGIYRIEGPKTLVVGTASDELVRYDITLRGDRLDITDGDGCRFSYERQTSDG